MTHGIPTSVKFVSSSITLKAANLTVHLSKSAFGYVQVQFLGRVVGGGEVKPITAKVDAINHFLIPNNKKRTEWLYITDDSVRTPV